MKGMSNKLALFAASFMIAGVALAQDKSVSFHQETVTNSTTNITFKLESEPKLQLGPNSELTGLFVDLLRPQETLMMLDPSVPSKNLTSPVPPSLLPVMPLQPLSNPAVHEANFAFLRLSFP